MELAERTGLTFDRVRDWKLQTGSLTPSRQPQSHNKIHSSINQQIRESQKGLVYCGHCRLIPKPLCSNCKILLILTTEYQSNPIWDSGTMKRISVGHDLPLNLIEEWYKRMVRFDPQIYLETDLAFMNSDQ